MRVLSLAPWLGATLPRVKTALLYGNHTDLRQFRMTLLQRLYQRQGYVSIMVKSWPALAQILTPQNGLFQELSRPYLIQLMNITDIFFKEKKWEPLLEETPHVLLLESATITTRSAALTDFEQKTDRFSLGCYDIDVEEMDQSVAWMATILNLNLDPEVRQILTHHVLNHLPDFFSILEFIALYVGMDELDEETLRQILEERLFSSSGNVSIAFFQQDTATLLTCLDGLESTDWIGQIRLLLQDVTALMGLSAHRLSPNALQNSWRQGPVKFPFPRLGLYQSVLKNNWSLERGYKMLSGLLTLESVLKSGDVLSPTIFKQKLMDLIQTD